MREEKGKEKDALSWIDQAINFGKGFVVNLYFERILVFQHLVMEEDSKSEGKKNIKKRNEALAKMEAATLITQKYVSENKLKSWESRVGVSGCKISSGIFTVGLDVRILYKLKNIQKIIVIVVNIATVTSLGALGLFIII